MPLSIKEAIEKVVTERPGIMAGEIARRLGRDRTNIRKAANEEVDVGRLIKVDTGNGYAFYPVGTAPAAFHFIQGNHAAPGQKNPVDHHRLQRRQPEPRVIDGVSFRDVTREAAGKQLVVAGQPYDSRLPAALAAKKRALQSPLGRAIAGQVITAMNELYIADPDGLETLAALQRAEFARAEAERIERERARQASAMAQQQAVEPSLWDMGMRAAILGFEAYCSMERQQAEARAAGRQSSATERAEPYEDYFARRQRAKREAEEVKPPSLLDRLRDRARTGTSPEGEAQPPVSDRPEWSWWQRHFGTPRRPVWR